MKLIFPILALSLSLVDICIGEYLHLEWYYAMNKSIYISFRFNNWQVRTRIQLSRQERSQLRDFIKRNIF